MSLRQSGGSERGAGAEGESSCEGRRKGNRGGGRGWSTLSHRRHGAGEAARGREKLGASFALAHLPIWKPPPLLLGCPRIWAWLQELGCGVWTGREAGWGPRAESVARTACCGCVAPRRFWGHPLGSNQVGPDPPISPPNPISPSNGARLAFVPAVQQGWSITLTAIPKPTLRPR